jgi:3-deoxy-7-phosphoheptulonate synthase
MNKWKLNSWSKYPAKHLPDYPDKSELDMVLEKIKKYPPLVFAGETRSLKKALADVVDGKAFLLQGGDCAESFAEFHPDNIRDTFKVLLQMSLVLTASARVPVVKVGRIAGQFSKPRSAPTEKKDGRELPSYLGDNINGMDFNEKTREPDAKRLFRAYSQSASTLNLLRAFSQGGFADLRQVHLWNLGFIKDKTKGKYKEIEDKISDALAFMEACGINSDTNRRLRTVNFYTSHEALLLPFEEAMTRIDSTTGEFHDTSAHFVWIGDRTRQLDGAHVEFCRGIKNPIGLKCGPTLKADDLIKLCHKLNQENEPGRLTLISRFGSDNVEKFLPKLVKTIKKEGLKVVWSCDPMHGNTIKAATGFKTRPFENVLKEVKRFFSVHQSEGTYAGGLHIEMTGQDVTECTGGTQKISEKDLSNRYRTHCDPRLNADQALELAFIISEEIKKKS